MRQEHLREYLRCCLVDNILTPADLLDLPGLWRKLTSTVNADLKVVGADLVKSVALKAVKAFEARFTGR